MDALRCDRAGRRGRPPRRPAHAGSPAAGGGSRTPARSRRGAARTSTASESDTAHAARSRSRPAGAATSPTARCLRAVLFTSATERAAAVADRPPPGGRRRVLADPARRPGDGATARWRPADPSSSVRGRRLRHWATGSPSTPRTGGFARGPRYWTGVAPARDLPVDRARRQHGRHQRDTVTSAGPGDHGRVAAQGAGVYRTQVNDVLLSALGQRGGRAGPAGTRC